jgi:carboxymethylenebutenolidase
MAERIVSLHAFYKSGTRELDAYLSRPTAPGPWPAVIVVYHGKVTTDPAEAAQLKTSLDIDGAVAEIVGAVPYLQSLPFVSKKVGIIGFCMGGGLALLAACRSAAFSAGVIYFPSIYPDTSELENVACPLRFH